LFLILLPKLLNFSQGRLNLLPLPVGLNIVRTATRVKDKSSSIKSSSISLTIVLIKDLPSLLDPSNKVFILLMLLLLYNN
jgi:hypothetical protein